MGFQESIGAGLTVRAIAWVVTGWFKNWFSGLSPQGIEEPEFVHWSRCKFTVFEPSQRFYANPGLYAFASRDPGKDEGWGLLYVREVESLDINFPTHRSWQAAAARGATHVHVVVVFDYEERKRAYKDIFDRYQPLLNVMRP